MRLGFSGALSVSNHIDWGCSRWDIQCKTSSCWHWESCLMQLQMIYTKTFESFWLFCGKSLELDLKQRGHSIGRKRTKLQQSFDGDYSTSGINMILAFLKGVLGSLQFWDDWSEPGGINPCRTLSLFLGVLGWSWSGDWTSHIAWCKFSYLEESPRISGLLYPAKYSRAFLQEQEPVALAKKLSNYRAGFDIA